nr:hypothetical protein CFP56_30678 [Quercus suber]
MVSKSSDVVNSWSVRPCCRSLSRHYRPICCVRQGGSLSGRPQKRLRLSDRETIADLDRGGLQWKSEISSSQQIAIFVKMILRTALRSSRPGEKVRGSRSRRRKLQWSVLRAHAAADAGTNHHHWPAGSCKGLIGSNWMPCPMIRGSNVWALV